MIIETRLEEEEAPKKLKRRRKPAATAENAADGAAQTADSKAAPVAAKPKRTKKAKPAENIAPKAEKTAEAAEEVVAKAEKTAEAAEEVVAKPAKKARATKKAKPAEEAQPAAEVVAEPQPAAEEKPAKKPRARKKVAAEPVAIPEATATPEPVAVAEPAEEPAAKETTEAVATEEPVAEAKPKRKSRKLKSVTDEIEIIPEELPAKPAKTAKKPRIKKAKAEPVAVAEAVPEQKAEVAEETPAASASPFAKYDQLINATPAASASPFAKYDAMAKEDETEKKAKPVFVKKGDAETRGKKKQQVLEEEMELMLDDESVAISKMTKGNIWSYAVDEIYEMLIEGRRAEHWAENRVHYMNIIRPVFDVVFFMRSDEKYIKQLEADRYKVFPYPPVNGILNVKTNEPDAIAIRKHQIKKITDLTMENIFHVEPREVLRLIEENMGTGWQGLPLPIQDIIQTAFYVDCSVLPATAMHRVGGIIDRRKEDGYEVLEIARGTWIEGVFIKHKPKMEKVRFESIAMRNERANEADDDDDDDDDDEDLTDEELNDRDEEDDDDMMEDQTPQIEDFDSIAEAVDDDD